MIAITVFNIMKKLTQIPRVCRTTSHPFVFLFVLARWRFASGHKPRLRSSASCCTYMLHIPPPAGLRLTAVLG